MFEIEKAITDRRSRQFYGLTVLSLKRLCGASVLCWELVVT